MVFILNGNLEIGAHVRSNFSYLICLRHLIISKAVANRILQNPKRPIFLQACAKCSELPSNINTMAITRSGGTSQRVSSIEGQRCWCVALFMCVLGNLSSPQLCYSNLRHPILCVSISRFLTKSTSPTLIRDVHFLIRIIKRI